MSTVIEASGLVTTFGRARALDGLDLRVDEGQVHGFLGPNGAGKSTTIRVLLGMLRPDAGTATVLGRDAWRDAAEIHRGLAYVPGDVSLWPNLTGGEAIDLLTRLRGGDPRSPERARLVERFDFDPTKACRSYSRGNRQKVALIAALATPAELYLFDEPTAGLDPLMESVFQDEVRAAAHRGATILLSSHILSEAERLCSHVSIVRAGRVVETGPLDAMRHLRRTVVSHLGEPVAGVASHDLAREGGRVSYSIALDELPAALRALADARAEGLTIQPPSLEELFLRHYGAEAAADVEPDPGHPGHPARRAHGRHAAPEGGDPR